jgi:hypothetical protein
MDAKRRISAGFGFDKCKPGRGHANPDSDNHTYANTDALAHACSEPVSISDALAHACSEPVSISDALAHACSNSNTDGNRHADTEAHAGTRANNA